MGAHSIPRGEKSSYGGANGSPRHNPDHVGKHRAEAGSDVPPRGKGVKHDNTKK